MGAYVNCLLVGVVSITAVLLFSGCSSGEVTSQPEAATAAQSVAAQVACDAYFDAAKAKGEVGVTITAADMKLLNEKFDAAIAAFTAGAASEPGLAQSIEELQTMRDELNKDYPNSMLILESSKVVTKTCLQTFQVKTPDWLNDAAGISR